MSAESLHPVASHHLPIFITAPGDTDVLMVVMAVILALSVIMFGVLFFTLHSLPERIAHKTHKLQFEIVAVLGLISLFTHMHIFWIIGLILALIEFPDFGGWMSRITNAVERMAGDQSTQDTEGKPDGAPSDMKEDKMTAKHVEVPRTDGAATIKRDDSAPKRTESLSHAES